LVNDIDVRLVAGASLGDGSGFAAARYGRRRASRRRGRHDRYLEFFLLEDHAGNGRQGTALVEDRSNRRLDNRFLPSPSDDPSKRDQHEPAPEPHHGASPVKGIPARSHPVPSALEGGRSSPFFRGPTTESH